MKKPEIPGLVALPAAARVDVNNKVFIRRRDCPVLKKQGTVEAPDEHVYIGYYDSETGRMVPILENYTMYIRPQYEDKDNAALQRAQEIESAPPVRYRINTAAFTENQLKKYEEELKFAEHCRGKGLEVSVPEYAYITEIGRVSVFPEDAPVKSAARCFSGAFRIGFYDDETGKLVPERNYKSYIDPNYKTAWDLECEQTPHLPIPDDAYVVGRYIYVPESSSPYPEYSGSDLYVKIGHSFAGEETFAPADNYYRYFSREEGKVYSYTDNHLILPEDGLLPVPEAARQKPDGTYILYAGGLANHDLPAPQRQWAIGEPSDQPGMLIPFFDTYQATLVKNAPLSLKDFPWNFDTSETYGQKKERERQEAYEEKMEEYNSFMYEVNALISLVVLRYFEESGIDEILRSLYGPILADRIEQTAAVFALYNTGCMDTTELGINLYMRTFRPFMNARMNDEMFRIITKCGTREFYDRWMALHEDCDPVAFCVTHRIKVYGEDEANRGMFWGGAPRDGVRSESDCVMFYDRKTEHYLFQQVENLGDSDWDFQDPYAAPVANEPYPQLKNPQIFLCIADSRHEDIPLLSQRYLAVTACLDIISKEVEPVFKKYEGKLESQQYKLNRHDEYAVMEPFEYKGVKGRLLIGVAPEFRSSLLAGGAKQYLTRFKQILQRNSLSVFYAHPLACYYDVQHEPWDDDDGFSGTDAPPRLSIKKDASKLFKRVAGYYAVFTTNPELTMDELVSAHYQSLQTSGHFSRHIHASEYGDWNEHLRDGFPGSNLVCLIARSLEFYLWKKSVTTKTPMNFADMRSKLGRVSVWFNSGNPQLTRPLDEETRELMKHFGITEQEMIDFAKSCYADIDRYFAEEEERELYDADIINTAIERHREEFADPQIMMRNQMYWY